MITACIVLSSVSLVCSLIVSIINATQGARLKKREKRLKKEEDEVVKCWESAFDALLYLSQREYNADNTRYCSNTADNSSDYELDV